MRAGKKHMENQNKIFKPRIEMPVISVILFSGNENVNWIVIKYYTNIPCDCGQYTRLLNDKEFCFSLIGLNSIFSTFLKILNLRKKKKPFFAI
jgi:hypothetical protein